MSYATARKAMVDSQLAPNTITDRAILEIFGTIPKELFLPEAFKHTCYKDEDIFLPNGRVIIENMTLAKQIQALDLSVDDVVLCLGDISGYAAAILSPMVSTVVRVEEDPHALAFSDEVYEELDMMNIVSIQGGLTQGDKAHAPFSKILLCGATYAQPMSLIEQLSYDGIMTYVERPNPLATGEIIKVKRIDHSTLEEEKLGMSAVPYCLGHEPEKEFAF